MINYYELTIDEASGVLFNALVDIPAHMKPMYHFGKSKEFQFVDESKRCVTGVMMSAGTPIIRFDERNEPYYVYFTAKTIEQIRDKYHKNNLTNNLNLMHDDKQIVDGAYMVESYLINRSQGKNEPINFQNSNLQEGSWIATFKIEDDRVWQMVLDGKFGGFSVEGEFQISNAKFQNQIKMKNAKKSIFDIFKSKQVVKQFATATTVDGVEVTYEGDLTEGTALFVVVDGEQLPAPEGEHVIEDADGNRVIITADANGIVSKVDTAEAMSTDDTIREEVAEAMTQMATEMRAEFTTQIEAVQLENVELKKQLADLKEGKKGSFSADDQDKKLSASEILANLKK